MTENKPGINNKRSTAAELRNRRATRDIDPKNVARLVGLMENPNEVPPRTEEEKAAIAQKYPPDVPKKD